MTEKTKSATYVGFAIRSGKYKIGGNTLSTIKSAHLIIVCKTASQNTCKIAQKYAKRFNCPLLKTATATLEELTFKPGSKVMAIVDHSLAKAIVDNANDDFISEV